MNSKTLLIVILLLVGLLSPSISYASSNSSRDLEGEGEDLRDFGGYLSLEYDTMSGQGLGEVYAYKTIFSPRLKVAGRLQTHLESFVMKDGYFPAGAPTSQTYDLEISFRATEDLSVYLIEGCNHYFSQSGSESYLKDKEYIKVGMKYHF